MWNRPNKPGTDVPTPGKARYDDIAEIQPDFSGKGLRVAIAMSRFNQDVCEGLLASCTAELKACGVAPEDMVIVTVPGALELPLAVQTLALSRRCDAVVALGCVIRGETYHFEVVSNEASRGIMDVQLQTGIPVANAVLTTETDDQAIERMAEKGKDAARVAIEMANLGRFLKT